MIKNKIIVTLGPSSLSREVVKKMDLLGVDIFRINLSHIDINEFEETILKVMSWTNKPVCPDTEGAQLRTGKVIGDNLKLVTGSTIKFVGLNTIEIREAIPLNLLHPEDFLLVGDLLRIGFESVTVQVTELANKFLIANQHQQLLQVRSLLDRLISLKLLKNIPSEI